MKTVPGSTWHRTRSPQEASVAIRHGTIRRRVGYARPVSNASPVRALARLISEKASAEGRMASAFPGLWFFRADRSRRIPRAHVSMTYLGVGGGGRKVIRAGGLEMAYDSEHFVVIRSNTDYEADIEASEARPYAALGLELPPGLVVRTLLDLVDSGTPEPPAASSAGWSGPLEPWLAEPLLRLLRCLDDRAERAVLAPLALREIVFRLLCSPGAPVLRGASVVNGERARIGAAMAFMEANAARRLTVPAVARHLAMSPSHFAHTFREVAGVAPMQYLKQVRLEQARSLLLAEGLSAGAVAGRVGYASASHFSRDFKRSFGLAPARYAVAFERGSTAPARASQDQARD